MDSTGSVAAARAGGTTSVHSLSSDEQASPMRSNYVTRATSVLLSGAAGRRGMTAARTPQRGLFFPVDGCVNVETAKNPTGFI